MSDGPEPMPSAGEDGAGSDPSATDGDQPGPVIDVTDEEMADAGRQTVGLVVFASGEQSSAELAAATVASANGARLDETVVVGGPDDDTWMATTSEFLVMAPAGVVLSDDAADLIRHMVLHNPEIDFAYFDSTGHRSGNPDDLINPRHRPGFSPDRLRAQMYLGELFLVRRTVAVAHQLAGRSIAAPLAHGDANFLLDGCQTVAHLPQMLYRAPEDLDPRAETTEQRLNSHQEWLHHEQFPATAMIRPGDRGLIDLEPRLLNPPKVSVIIPTNGARREIDGANPVLCLQAVASIVANTSYQPGDYELVVVTTPGAPADLATDVMACVDDQAQGRPRPTVRFCRDERPFNFSNACNRGAVAAGGTVLIFLNDDTVVRTRNWIDRLVMYATHGDIGATGARLLYGDGRIQHGGIWSRGGHPTHRYEGFPAEHHGYLDSLLVPQNCVAVTGACLAVEASKFFEVGGFSPQFPSSYNDVDLCLKLDDHGYRTVVDPAVVLTHFEASSRDPKIDDWELALLHERWRTVITNDPYDNPHHLAPQSGEFPAPDPVITECKRAAGGIDHLARLWPRPRLTLDLSDETSGGKADQSGGHPREKSLARR